MAGPRPRGRRCVFDSFQLQVVPLCGPRAPAVPAAPLEFSACSGRCPHRGRAFDKGPLARQPRKARRLFAGLVRRTRLPQAGVICSFTRLRSGFFRRRVDCSFPAPFESYCTAAQPRNGSGRCHGENFACHFDGPFRPNKKISVVAEEDISMSVAPCGGRGWVWGGGGGGGERHTAGTPRVCGGQTVRCRVKLQTRRPRLILPCVPFSRSAVALSHTPAFAFRPEFDDTRPFDFSKSPWSWSRKK